MHLPVLRQGSRGPDVAKLQRLLNSRLTPSPDLKPDGQFGPLTAQAVGEFQRGVGIANDQVVGKVTWYHLLKGEVVHLTPAQPPGPPAPAGKAGVASPNGPPAGPAQSSPPKPTVESIWEWPLEKKILAAIERVPSRLVPEARKEWDALVIPEGLALTLVIIAAFCLLSGGTALVLGILILGADVCFSLASALIRASQAATKEDLDAAADDLAHIVIAIGVGVFLRGVGKIAGKIRARGGSEAPAAPAPKGPVPTRPKAPSAEATTSRGPTSGSPAPKPTTEKPAANKEGAQRRAREKMEQGREQARQQKIKDAVKKAERDGKLDKLDPADRKWLNDDPTGRRKELAYDPDTKSFKPNEAKAALRAEQDGVLDPPVRRAFDQSGKSGGDDIVDGSGKPWDVKDASAGPDQIVDIAAPKGGKTGENVLVDASKMTPEQQRALEAEVASKQKPGSGEIRFVPKR